MSALPHATARKGSGGGFLLGMFVGLLIGLAVALGIALYLNKTPIPFMSRAKPPAEDAKAPGKPPALAGMPQSGTAPATAPVPASKAAAAAAKAPEKPRFDFYKILAGGEEPVSERELRERLRAVAAAKSQPAASPDVYFIQAGAFQNPADADNQKARLAILGLESNVEPTNLPDKGTWYRVRLGPYTKVDELNKVRQSLAQNGIDANLVKLKDPASAKAN